MPNVHLQRGRRPSSPTAAARPCAVRSARACCSDARTCCSPPGRPVRRITAPGRDNKVGREETLGMLAAVEALGEARSRGRMEDVARLARHDRRSASRRLTASRRPSASRTDSRTRVRHCRSPGTPRSCTSRARSGRATGDDEAADCRRAGVGRRPRRAGRRCRARPASRSPHGRCSRATTRSWRIASTACCRANVRRESPRCARRR